MWLSFLRFSEKLNKKCLGVTVSLYFCLVQLFLRDVCWCVVKFIFWKANVGAKRKWIGEQVMEKRYLHNCLIHVMFKKLNTIFHKYNLVLSKRKSKRSSFFGAIFTRNFACIGRPSREAAVAEITIFSFLMTMWWWGSWVTF